ncbi:hypothetical protein [Listeria grayi]|uniref:hypothetical protein n=1 Tax=Listeria grayi TaxID=1641 RepID=UPI0016280AF7|nr:hypothetical protein [Listeria grayi]MBC1923017.1 hypothetical protein [Listeria grayi]
MAHDRSSFDIEPSENDAFTPLVKKKKKNVEIAGENNFSSKSLGDPSLPSLPPVKKEKSLGKKRGRPVEIKDPRYKVNVPKKISPALQSKLTVLQDYMTELQETPKGRITFEKVITALADSYIKNRLAVAKEEHIKKELDMELEKLK